MQLSITLTFLGLLVGCYAVATNKKCSRVQGEKVTDASDGYNSCQTWCPVKYADEEQVQGSCKSYWTGYYCQCMYKVDEANWTPVDTEKSCEFTKISLVDDSSDGLKTCEAWCKVAHNLENGECLPYISGSYCSCTL